MKIRLETRDGSLVHESRIPPFNEAPAVIGWGDRVFESVLRIPDAEYDPEDGVEIYREIFAYALTDNPNT